MGADALHPDLRLDSRPDGCRYGTLVMLMGVLGILSGGRLADHLLRRGYTDAKMRVCLIAALGNAVFLALYPLLTSGGWSMVVFTPVMFFTAFPMGAAAAAIQEVTPGEIRAQASSIYLFVANLIGLGLGPTAVAIVTDYVFGSDDALRFSLVIVGTAAALGAALLFGLCLRPYRTRWRRPGTETKRTRRATAQPPSPA